MNVDFNNLRVQALLSYHRLCTELNLAIKDKSFDPVIIISPSKIQKEMDMLRFLIGSIACVFEEGDENFKMVKDEVPDLAEFNPDPE